MQAAELHRNAEELKGDNILLSFLCHDWITHKAQLWYEEELLWWRNVFEYALVPNYSTGDAYERDLLKIVTVSAVAPLIIWMAEAYLDHCKKLSCYVECFSIFNICGLG